MPDHVKRLTVDDDSDWFGHDTIVSLAVALWPD